MKKILEICVDSLASAKAAIQGGADRLELCSALSIGGITPYIELLAQIRKDSDIEIRSMIRPRAGDFLYDRNETEIMINQIKNLKAAGSNGFVIGCLTKDGKLDIETLKPLIDVADGADLTLHRAIDVSQNLEDTYRLASQLGFKTILTSGGAENCIIGKETIKKLLDIKEEINGAEVLIGAGVNADIISQFRLEFPKASSFHMSGKINKESGMIFRKENVPMGIPNFDEWHIQKTSAELVKAARFALDK